MRKFELIDVVDNKDNVIETVERTENWEQTGRPDCHRVVQVIIENTKGEILVQQRLKTKKMYPFLFDSSVGGLVSAGLTYEEAAKKEMQEELGISADLEFIAKNYNNRKDEDNSQNYGGCFTATFKAFSDGPYTNWQEEAERLDFMTHDEIKFMLKRFPYLFTPGFILSMQSYFANN